MSEWVRLWHDMPTDPKWRVIARKSGKSIPLVISVFNFVLVNASCNTMKRGETHNLVAEDIAAALDVLESDVETILESMQGKVLDGIRLTGWEKRQPFRDDNSTSRVKRWRETQRNASKRPDSESDTDKKEKKDVSIDTSKENEMEFIEWWITYPEKIGKGQARKAYFKARRKASREDLLAGVVRYKSHKPSDRSWAHPATWLNGERWLDAPSAAPAGRSSWEDEAYRGVI